jgi:hypothetical protein
MAKHSLRFAASVFLLGTHPSLPARLERPDSPPGVAAPAPESPLPARAVESEGELSVGALRLRVVPAPSSEARGEWNPSLQTALFQVYFRTTPARVTTAAP